MNTSDVTAPVQETKATVPFAMMIGGIVGFVTFPVLLPAMANTFLPPADAAVAKAFYENSMGTMFLMLVGGGGGIAATGSLASRIAKLIAQLAPGIPTVATPNGEGIQSAASIANGEVADAIESATDDVTGAITDAADEITSNVESVAGVTIADVERAARNATLEMLRKQGLVK